MGKRSLVRTPCDIGNRAEQESEPHLHSSHQHRWPTAAAAAQLFLGPIVLGLVFCMPCTSLHVKLSQSPANESPADAVILASGETNTLRRQLPPQYLISRTVQLASRQHPS